MSYDLLTVSDISAALVGYLYADQLNTGKPAMQASQSFIVSIIARLAARSNMTSWMGKLDNGQKNQLIVAVLSALAGSYKGGNAVKGALTGTSIDLIAEDVIRMLNIDDRGFFNMGNIAPAGYNPMDPTNPLNAPGN